MQLLLNANNKNKCAIFRFKIAYSHIIKQYNACLKPLY